MKKNWEGIKQMISINNKIGPGITQLNYLDNQLNTDLEISNAFNDFFTKIGPNLDKEIPKLRGDITPSYYLKNKIPN